MNIFVIMKDGQPAHVSAYECAVPDRSDETVEHEVYIVDGTVDRFDQPQALMSAELV